MRQRPRQVRACRSAGALHLPRNQSGSLFPGLAPRWGDIDSAECSRAGAFLLTTCAAAPSRAEFCFVHMARRLDEPGPVGCLPAGSHRGRARGDHHVRALVLMGSPTTGGRRWYHGSASLRQRPGSGERRKPCNYHVTSTGTILLQQPRNPSPGCFSALNTVRCTPTSRCPLRPWQTRCVYRRLCLMSPLGCLFQCQQARRNTRPPPKYAPVYDSSPSPSVKYSNSPGTWASSSPSPSSSTAVSTPAAAAAPELETVLLTGV